MAKYRPSRTVAKRALRELILNEGRPFSLARMRIPAKMGDGNGTVAVPGRPGYVYVRVGRQITKVFNGRVPHTEGLDITIGYDSLMPNVPQVLGQIASFGDVVTSDGAPHHESHEYPGADTTWIKKDQFLPMLVLPTTGFTVQVFGNVLYANGAWVTVENQTVDLTSHKPTAGARYVLLQAGVTGVVTVKSGVLKGSRTALTLADVPVPDADNYPMCAVALYDGQELIQRDTRTGKINDFFDLRFSGYASSSAGDVLTNIVVFGGNVITFNGEVVSLRR